MRFISSIVLICVLVLAGCDKKAASQQPMNFSEIAKVKVTTAGQVTVNGKSLSLAEFETELKRLKLANGAVSYWRENPGQGPTEAQLEAFKKIMEAKLPVKLVEKERDLD